MKRTLTAIYVFSSLLAATGVASAQEPFADLQSKVKLGDQVSITDDSGQQTRGTLEHLGPTVRLSVDGASREWMPQQITEIRRRGDSLRNGLAVGAASGGTAGALLGLAVASMLRNEGLDGGQAVLGLTALGVGIGAGIGVGLDALVTGSTVVYQRPTRSVWVAPVVSPTARGVRLGVSF
jgi:hypothetical protein